jgi:biotin carboxyl carrier protein
VVRLPLRLDEESHWPRLARDHDGLAVRLARHWHRVCLNPGAEGRLAGDIDGRPIHARVESEDGVTVVRRQCLRFEFTTDTGVEHRASAEHEGHLRAPMPGHVLDVRARVGAQVEAGSVLVLLEAMKMEHSLAAPWPGRVTAVSVKPGDRVEEGADLVILEPLEEPHLRQAAEPD